MKNVKNKKILDDYMRSEIFAAMFAKGIRKQNILAKKTGIPQSTMSVHLSDLDRMTLGELRRIAEELDLIIRIERRHADGN